MQLVTRLEDDLQSAVLRQGPDAALQAQGSTAQQPGNSMLGIVTNQRDRFRRRCVCWTTSCHTARTHAASAARQFSDETCPALRSDLVGCSSRRYLPTDHVPENQCTRLMRPCTAPTIEPFQTICMTAGCSSWRRHMQPPGSKSQKQKRAPRQLRAATFSCTRRRVVYSAQHCMCHCLAMRACCACQPAGEQLLQCIALSGAAVSCRMVLWAGEIPGALCQAACGPCSSFHHPKGGCGWRCPGSGASVLSTGLIPALFGSSQAQTIQARDTPNTVQSSGHTLVHSFKARTHAQAYCGMCFFQ